MINRNNLDDEILIRMNKMTYKYNLWFHHLIKNQVKISIKNNQMIHEDYSYVQRF